MIIKVDQSLVGRMENQKGTQKGKSEERVSVKTLMILTQSSVQDLVIDRQPGPSAIGGGLHLNSTSGFDHRREREHSSWANRSRTRKWTRASDSESASDVESDDNINSCRVGLLSDRTILGLPLTGPLKIGDVKNAFRLSALKWHPDKHQGPSQAMAEEKFKQCVNAYKSLCSAISTA